MSETTPSRPGRPDALIRRWGPMTSIVLALLVQVLAAAFFLGDSLQELSSDGEGLHPMTELPVTIALCIGIWLTTRELRRLAQRSAEQDRALALASGAFQEVVERQFDAWRLTAAERDVAWLSLKGVEPSEIAVMRGSAQGTVRAQLARVYGKSGVSSRAQFASLFVDELMGGLPVKSGEASV